MILTGDGALLAIALAALVGGLVFAWALWRVAVRRSRTSVPGRRHGKAGPVRRVIVPAGSTPRV